MRPAHRILLSFVVVVAVLGAVAVLPSQTPEQEDATPGASPAAAVVKRTVLPDGTVEFQYADGTTRRIPGATMPPSQAEGESDTAGATGLDQIAPVAPPPWLNDPATNKAFLDAMGQYYAYRATGLLHRQRVFEWQLLSSKVIFVTVLMLVGSGMVFAAIQFHTGLKRAGVDASQDATEIDLSATSVKVSSPVLGVIILVISLAFFYLYLVYVYPISEIV